MSLIQHNLLNSTESIVHKCCLVKTNQENISSILSTPSSPSCEARQARHFLKHAKHVSTPSTPNTWARQTHKRRKARYLANSERTKIKNEFNQNLLQFNEYCDSPEHSLKIKRKEQLDAVKSVKPHEKKNVRIKKK